MVLPCRLPGPASAGGTGGRRAAEPGGRSAAGTGGRAPVRRTPAPRSWDHRPVRRSAGSRRPGSRGAAGSASAAVASANGPAAGRPAGAAGPRVASAAGRSRRRPGPAPRRRPAGRRGDRPGVFAWVGHRHRGPGRYHRVPPGTSWTVWSSRAAGHALPDECRSGEIPGRTKTANCHQLHIIRWYYPDNARYRRASSDATESRYEPIPAGDTLK